MIPVPKHPGWPKVIDALQQKAGMTQTQIEDETGISQSFLSNLKSSRRDSLKFDNGMRLFTLYLERVRGMKLMGVSIK